MPSSLVPLRFVSCKGGVLKGANARQLQADLRAGARNVVGTGIIDALVERERYTSMVRNKREGNKVKVTGDTHNPKYNTELP